MSRALYVIGFSPSPWVLSLEARTEDEAARSINWQRKAELNEPGPPARWEVCTRTGPAEFVTGSGETITVADRSPYTVKAWAEFLATWPA